MKGRTDLSFPQQLESAAASGTGILWIRTADIPGTVREIVRVFNKKRPIVHWNCQQGLTADFSTIGFPLNKEGDAEIDRMLAIKKESEGFTVTRSGGKPTSVRDADGNVMPWAQLKKEFAAFTRSYYEVLNKALELGKDTETPEGQSGALIIYERPNRFCEDANFITGLGNLRDAYNRSNRMVILVDSVVNVPNDLIGDVKLLSDKLPDKEKIAKVLSKHYAGAINQYAGKVEIPALSEEHISAAVKRLVGLSAYQVEQSVAESMSSEIIRGAMNGGAAAPQFSIADFIYQLGVNKRDTLNQVKGLKVNDEAVDFTKVGGYGYIKDRLVSLANGKIKFNAICFLDEMDKLYGGAGNQQGGGIKDSSGVTTDMLGLLLSFMESEKREVYGLVFLGAPGCAKSFVAKAAGTLFDCEVIEFSITKMKEGLVGASTNNLAIGLDVVDAVSDGAVLFIGTCNSIGSLPPELQRRFPETFFFGYPETESEYDAIWKLYETKYEVIRPANWKSLKYSPAEIRNVCKSAWNESRTVESVRIVPAWDKNAATIHRQNKRELGEAPSLYQVCTGSYIDANTGETWYAYWDEQNPNFKTINEATPDILEVDAETRKLGDI